MSFFAITAEVGFDGLKSARDVAAVKAAWRKGWINLNPNAETAEDYLAKKDRAKAAKSYAKQKGLGNIHGTSLGRQM